MITQRPKAIHHINVNVAINCVHGSEMKKKQSIKRCNLKSFKQIPTLRTVGGWLSSSLQSLKNHILVAGMSNKSLMNLHKDGLRGDERRIVTFWRWFSFFRGRNSGTDRTWYQWWWLGWGWYLGYPCLGGQAHIWRGTQQLTGSLHWKTELLECSFLTSINK